MKVALIKGVTGQDGSYLAEFLLGKMATQQIDHIYQDPHEENPRFKLHYGNWL